MKTLGIIGGMGPLASSHFYQLLVQHTKADTDQEHPDILICGMSSIPDRSAYILGISEVSPLDKIIIAGQKLIDMGADIIAIPCITSHFFYPDIAKRLSRPVINAVDITAKKVEQLCQKVAVLSTSGTSVSGTLHKSLSEHGLELVTLSRDDENEVMSIIYAMKASKDIDINRFLAITATLFDKGAQSIILGCTELSIIKYRLELDKRFVDPLTILVEESLIQCGVPLKSDSSG